MTSIHVLEIDSGLIDFFNDVTRIVTIYLATMFMLFVNGDTQFLSAEVVLLLCYIILGVALYWLVVRRFISVVRPYNVNNSPI